MDILDILDILEMTAIITLPKFQWMMVLLQGILS